MLNHVATHLTLNGDASQIARLIANVTTEDGKIDFNRLFPMPPVLREIRSPVNVVSDEEADKDRIRYEKDLITKEERDYVMGRSISATEQIALIAQYGSDGWYDWAHKNWGTKWGIYEVRALGNNCFAYHTAWSPATPFWTKVSGDYPGVIIKHEFSDEGGGFVGFESFLNGEMTDSGDFEWDSGEGLALRTELGYGPDETDESDKTE